LFDFACEVRRSVKSWFSRPNIISIVSVQGYLRTSVRLQGLNDRERERKRKRDRTRIYLASATDGYADNALEGNPRSILELEMTCKFGLHFVLRGVSLFRGPGEFCQDHRRKVIKGTDPSPAEAGVLLMHWRDNSPQIQAHGSYRTASVSAIVFCPVAERRLEDRRLEDRCLEDRCR
jgi:hypothetical protein